MHRKSKAERKGQIYADRQRGREAGRKRGGQTSRGTGKYINTKTYRNSGR